MQALMAVVSLTAELKSSDDSIKQSGILKISCNTPPENLTGQGHCKMFVLEQSQDKSAMYSRRCGGGGGSPATEWNL